MLLLKKFLLVLLESKRHSLSNQFSQESPILLLRLRRKIINRSGQLNSAQAERAQGLKPKA